MEFLFYEFGDLGYLINLLNIGMFGDFVGVIYGVCVCASAYF